MERSAGQRTIAGVLALLAQAGLILVFVQSRGQQRGSEADSARLMIIQLPVAEPETPRAEPRRTSTVAPIAAPAPAELRTEPEPITAPTTLPEEAPRIDWYGDKQRTAKAFADKETRRLQQPDPLDSKPRALQLPKEGGGPPPPYTEQRLDNGDLLTRHRVNENLTIVCKHRQIPLNQHFEALARKGAALCRKPKQIESRMPVDFSDLKPDLRRPLPKPGPAEDRD